MTPARQKKIIRTLQKTGCVSDACRKAGVSTTSAYRARKRLPGFARQWAIAIAMASTELEAIAYQRAVEGAEEQIIRDGKVVAVKKKPSDAMLRTVLHASNPKKYGRQGAVLRKQIEAEIRDKMIADVRAEVELDLGTHIDWTRPGEDLTEKVEAARTSIMKKLAKMRERDIRDGWREVEGRLVPPGFDLVVIDAGKAAAWRAAQAAGAPEQSGPE